MQRQQTLFGKKVKGISPLIATLILIAITIVGGILVYHVFFSTAGTISSSSGLQIQSADIYASEGVVTLTVKNTGSIPITSISATIYPPSGVQQPSSYQFSATGISSTHPLVPGNTTYLQATGVQNLIAGEQYTIVITAQGSNGATFTTSVQVTAQS